MILDQFGKPVRPLYTFITPEWMTREGLSVLRERGDIWRERMIIKELRESLGVGGSPRVGDTISVKLPRRFAKDTDV